MIIKIETLKSKTKEEKDLEHVLKIAPTLPIGSNYKFSEMRGEVWSDLLYSDRISRRRIIPALKSMGVILRRKEYHSDKFSFFFQRTPRK